LEIVIGDRGCVTFRDVANKRWSRFLGQPAKVDSPMQRTNHHEDAEKIFG
jgi:hypothetical protein